MSELDRIIREALEGSPPETPAVDPVKPDDIQHLLSKLAAIEEEEQEAQDAPDAAIRAIAFLSGLQTAAQEEALIRRELAED